MNNIELLPEDILKKYWKYDSFRPLQAEIIAAILEGGPVLALLPTGGGKSLCYQVPGMLLEGICLVVSPLIALMKDQVQQLSARGIKASAVYSGMSYKEIDVVLDNCIYGHTKFLYVSPERLQTDLFQERAKQMKINMIAIDEAHCISQWGYDFRPPYMEIATFIELIGIKKVMALTASATKEVKADILAKLDIEAAKVFTRSFARDNLSYSVFRLENKEQKMLEILQNVPGSSVVYVRNRKQTRELARFLVQHKIPADYYHAGLPSAVRSIKQDRWMEGKSRVMVATNAFGMGIDKPDVRTVIHFDLSDSVEAYYQEAGRAGRDGKKAYAIQLYASHDLKNFRTRTEQAAVSIGFIKKTYQALANQYKLAVGSTSAQRYPFDYAAFITRFELPMVETYHAIKKLGEAGLIEMTESFRESSKLNILLDQEGLYRYQVANSSMDALLKVILRLYGGELFTDFMPIKEQDISALLGLSREDVVNKLTYLHQAEVVSYEQVLDIPSIVFLTERYAAEDLPLDAEYLEVRRQIALDKAQAVEKYVTNLHLCRSLMLQKYFDERSDEACGICDICIGKNKQGQVPTTSIDQVNHYIRQQQPSPETLFEHFSSMDKEVLIQCVRVLLDEGKVSFSDGGVYTPFEVKL